MRALQTTVCILSVFHCATAFAEDCTIDFRNSPNGITKFWGRSGGRVLLYYQGTSTLYCTNVGSSDSVLIYGSNYADTIRPCSLAQSGCTAYSVPTGAWQSFQIVGGPGHDVLACGTIPCQLDGGSGNDNLAGGDGDDVLNGDDDCDFLDGWGGDDYLSLGYFFGSDGCTGAQTAVDFLGDNIIIGSNGVDYIAVGEHETSTSNTVYGMGGDDQIQAFGGYQILYGDAGDDDISAGSITAKVVGGTGSDTLSVNAYWACICGHNCGSSSTAGDGNDNMEGWGSINFFCDTNTYDIDSFFGYVSSASYHQHCGANAGDSCTNMDEYNTDTCAACLDW